MALILHANWNDGALRVWAESHEAYLAAADSLAGADTEHRFAVSAEQLEAALRRASLLWDEVSVRPSVMHMRLPCDETGPMPSDRLAGRVGAIDDVETCTLQSLRVPCLALPNEHVLSILLNMEDRGTSELLDHSPSLRYWIAVGRFVLELLADQRFIPTLFQERDDHLRAAWQPWLHDEGIRTRAGAMIAAMPPVCRAVVDDKQANAWSILSEALQTLTDATVRHTLIREDFADALEDLDPQIDAHVAWLSGLLSEQTKVTPPSRAGVDLLRDAGVWVSRLDEADHSRPLRLCLMLHEPIDSALLPDKEPISGDVKWRLSLHLQSAEHPERMIDAEQLWTQPAGAQRLGDQRVDQPQELFIAELGRASRIYNRLEEALSDAAPTGLELTTKQAYEFLREHTPVLEEAGFGVVVPIWWDEPASRLGARLQITSPTHDELLASEGDAQSGTTGQVGASSLGLSALVQYQWQIAVGDQPLSMQEFQQLANQSSPLVRVQGRWVEIRPDDMQQAVAFLSERPGGEMTLLEAIQVAHGADGKKPGLPVTGLDATGWVADLLGASEDPQSVPILDQPAGFDGTLRPYQKMGLSWMSFLDRFGLGACLADDMGLGKTIQLIALLLHERESAEPGLFIGPTLLVVPTSVVSNWTRELQRFAPQLTSHVHHGPDRPMGDDFVELARDCNVIITTYALISRDSETLSRVHWHRVALDEAQYIKNPPTKQTAAIRSLKADRRLALTGTPVENRLTELWSIMEFCNPGYLGGPNEFRSRFAVPIERHRDQHRAEALRQLVRPFVLRRLKTDPKVINDLPQLVETKEYATLSSEQAAMYERTVNEMLEAVDSADGIQRRGLVLATLVKLKQICNFPQQVLRKTQSAGSSPDNLLLDGVSLAGLSKRSGKTQRLLSLLEEVLASDGKALIFTQFRQMGHLLTMLLRHELDTEALFLHGGTPQGKRQQMIDRFQSPQGAPIFVLSLKAGGLGLNLTAANHVFHFDRWWNPAVENQATDRAFRIGQKRKVHVHKFVCVGTLEERIDQMIEQKTQLAENIIGSGEQWITELSTGQLQDLLTLRRAAAMEVEA
jgi:SNF2 family DNA or RNA helicase